MRIESAKVGFIVKGGEQSDHIYKTREYWAKVAKEIYKEIDPDNQRFIDALDEIEKIKTRFPRPKSVDDDYNITKKLYSDYMEVYNSFESDEDKLKLVSMNAKLNDIWRSAGKIAAREIVNVHHESDNERLNNGGSNADRFEFTYLKLANEENPVSASYVQSLTDRSRTNVKLTMHPTNSSNVEHTVLGMRLENTIDNPNSTPDDIKSAIVDYLKAPVANLKKTPQTETQEIAPVRANLYEAAKIVRKQRNEALKKTGWADKGVVGRTPVITIHDWDAGGDGDGNPNIDNKALEDGINSLRKEIRGLYTKDLNSIRDAVSVDGLDESKQIIKQLIDSIEKNLQVDKAKSYKSPDQFVKDLSELKTYVSENPKISSMVEELTEQVKDFGFHFSKIDIRHDAPSINGTIQTLLQAAKDKNPSLDNIKTSAEFNDLSSEDKQKYLTSILSNDEVIKTMSSLQKEDITDKYGDAKTANRIFERMKTVGKNPDMVEELIIAEAKKPEDVLSAMILLKSTGNEVANEKAKIHIVTLLEDLPDLKESVENDKKLAANPEYAKHLYYLSESRKMVAESDNRRRNGQSAGEVINEVLGESIAIGGELGEIVMSTVPAEIIKRDKDKGIERKFQGQQVINGGGEDLARGAQNKATEVGFNQGYFAEKHGADTMLSPSCTIQGHQTRLLFSSIENAAYTIQGMMSQTMYAIGGVEGEISKNSMTSQKDKLQTQARQDAKVFHKEGRKWFGTYSSNKSFDNLFKQAGAWVTGILSNMGSRPNKRGGGGIGEDVTVAGLVGDNPQILAQRAITASGITKFSGSPSLTLLGQKEATEELLKIEEKKGRKPGNMYDNSKPERNHIRANAIMIFNENFSKFWLMSGMERPSSKEVKELASQFDPKGDNSPKVTLAFYEQYVQDLAKVTYKAIHGIDPEKLPKYENKEFVAQDLLHDTWPELARQLYLIKKDVGFADAIETSLNKQFNANRDTVLNAQMEELVRTVASVTSRRNTADGMMGVYTELHKDARGSELPGVSPTAAKSSFTAKIMNNLLKVSPGLVKLAENLGIKPVGNYLDHRS